MFTLNRLLPVFILLFAIVLPLKGQFGDGPYDDVSAVLREPEPEPGPASSAAAAAAYTQRPMGPSRNNPPEPIYENVTSAIQFASEYLDEGEVYKLDKAMSPSMWKMLELWSYAYHSVRIYPGLFFLKKRFEEDPTNTEKLSFTSPPTEDELRALKKVLGEDFSNIRITHAESILVAKATENMSYGERAEGDVDLRDRYLTPSRMEREDAEEDSSDDEGDGQP